MTMNKNKIENIIAALSLKEKAAICSGYDAWYTESVENFGIKKIRMSDGPNGLRKEVRDNENNFSTKEATCFPAMSLLAASFDTDMMYEFGKTLAAESKAEKIDLLLGPGVNIKRSPLCGRNFEYLSEDPYLSGELGTAMVKGMQENGVGATIKHFALNNQEKARLSENSVADERAKREIYLEPFERIVKQANPWALMCAYNKIDGTYSSENKELLTETLRKSWGFDGFVMSDWGATNDRVLGIKAGLDLEMPSSDGTYDKIIIDAVKSGHLLQEELDTVVQRILEAAIKAERQRHMKALPYTVEFAHDKAREFAAKSMVLLKNENNILPLNHKKRLAILGEFAKNPRYQGGGSANVHPTMIPSFLDELEKEDLEFVFSEGYITQKTGDFVLTGRDVEPMTPKDENIIAEALIVTENCDTVLILAGTPQIYESEGYDRPNMRLPENQNKLIEKVSAVNPNTVVVLFAGSAVEMPWIDHVKAVLMCYLPGQAGVAALTDILFGRVSPSGKLPESFPLSLSDTPCFPYFGQTRTVEYRESIYVGYRYYDSASKEVLFPFGYGLSYTEFRYSDLNVKQLDNAEIQLTVTIKNIGKRDGAEGVQLYISPPDSEIYRPAQELKGIQKLFLTPGETKTATFRLTQRDFAVYVTKTKDFRVPKGVYFLRVGSSSRDIRLSKTITIEASHPGYIFEDLRNVAPEYYDLTRLHAVSNASFFAILEKEFVPFKPKPFTRCSTLSEIVTTRLGKKIMKKVRSMYDGGNNADEQEGHDINVMLEAQAPYLPIGVIVMNTKGSFNEEMLDGLLLRLNGKHIRGYYKIFKNRPKKKRENK